MRRTGIVAILVGWAMILSAPIGWATEPGPEHQITVTCTGNSARLEIGDHSIGMISYDADGAGWHHLDETAGPVWVFDVPAGTKTVTVWATLDGLEVDPKAYCEPPPPPPSTSSTTSTTSTSSTLPPTTTTITVPPTTTSSSTPTTSTMPPTTTSSTTTIPPSTTVPPSTTTTTTVPPRDCDDYPEDEQPPWNCVITGVGDWTWPIGLIGASALLGGGFLIGVTRLMAQGYRFDWKFTVEPDGKTPSDAS